MHTHTHASTVTMTVTILTTSNRQNCNNLKTKSNIRNDRDKHVTTPQSFSLQHLDEYLRKFVVIFVFREDVRKIFSKYVKNFVQRLKKPDALTMLQEEFSLTEKEAEIIFELFDKDQNCELSLWEFQQFYTTVGAK